MIISRVLLPDATSVRKNASKMHGRIPVLLTPSVHFSGVPWLVTPSVHFSGVPWVVTPSMHFSGVLAAVIILLLIHLRAAALESSHYRPDALR